MNQEENGLRILKAEIKNFKNIDYKQIDIDGRSIILAGPNQAGKSSMIQALMSPVDSRYIPIEPVTQGEEKGHVQLVIGGTLDGEPVRYNVGVHFSPGNKRGKLTLEDAEGAKFKDGTKGILDQIVGDISFDIMKFIDLGVTPAGKVSKEGVRKQIEILKGLMPKEDVQKLNALDVEKVEIYDKRTEINRDFKFLENKVKEAGFSQEDIEKYSEPKSVKELSEKISAARKKNETYDKCMKIIDSADENRKELNDEIKELEIRLEKRRNERKQIDEQEKQCQEWTKNNPKQDISEMEMELETISNHNTKHEQVKNLDQTAKDAREKKEEADKITERLKEIDNEKKEIFASTKMPVKGLAFNEETVTFRDLPLSDGNTPSSQLIGIGLKIGMALNPNLRVLVIRDGSLLDDKTMNYILKTCEKHGYQLLIEVVRSNEGELTIEFVES